MRVFLEVASGLTRYTQGQSLFEVEVSPNATVEEAIHKAGIPEEALGLLAMNRQKVDLDQTLQEDDRVMILPLIMGG